ncbi:MAG: tetratricopeptide repeat protein, partial [Thermoguttaceae bacterium]|nr:tetratricopeptide repeat protein [Thermoguttaceae bacterium]
MRRIGCFVVPWLMLLSFGNVLRIQAAEILLKDGRILSGKPGVTAGMAEKPVPPNPDGSGPLQLIVFVDDDLRRTFVPKRQIREVRQDAAGQVLEKFVIPQRVSRAGRSVAAVGPSVRVTPFDEYGRRIFTMNTPQGQVDVIQGITEITPQWIKVEGLVAEKSVVWDMRLATSSLPQETLATILSRQIDPKNLEHRKRIAAFYLQTGRPDDAAKELEQILAEFTQDPEVQQQLDRLTRLVKQVAAQKLLEELELRRGAGQHRLVLAALKSFPSEGVAGENLQRVREIIGEYENWDSQRKTLVGKFDTLLEQINESSLREAVRPIRDEIERELGPNTLERM